MDEKIYEPSLRYWVIMVDENWPEGAVVAKFLMHSEAQHYANTANGVGRDVYRVIGRS